MGLQERSRRSLTSGCCQVWPSFVFLCMLYGVFFGCCWAPGFCASTANSTSIAKCLHCLVRTSCQTDQVNYNQDSANAQTQRGATHRQCKWPHLKAKHKYSNGAKWPLRECKVWCEGRDGVVLCFMNVTAIRSRKQQRARTGEGFPAVARTPMSKCVIFGR